METLKRYRGAALVVAGLILVAFFPIRSCRIAHNDLANLRDLQGIKDDTIRYWKDAAGTEHAEKQVAIASFEAARIVWRHELDSVAQLLKIKPKDIQELKTIGTVAAGTISPVVVTISGPGQPHVQRISYEDQWLSLDGVVADTAVFTYRVRDSLTLTTYRKKVGLFRYNTVVDGYSHNPNAHITGLSSLQIKTPAPGRIGIGPYFGYGFDGQRWAPSAGLSIHYSLIRF